uniref:SHSP domain-containing protein n=1 Tax=Pygocentrus nattereri TaxID=42514 RepID=A0A3B4ER78_PYGNA
MLTAKLHLKSLPQYRRQLAEDGFDPSTSGLWRDTPDGTRTHNPWLRRPIFEKVSQTAASDVVQQVSYAVEKEGGGFALSMHAKDFSPEEMSIKQVGRTLHVCGKTEKREEAGEGSYSHRVQEFRREFLLPEGVNPEVLSCSLAEGKLFIQTPKTQQSEKPDRLLTIDWQSKLEDWLS